MGGVKIRTLLLVLAVLSTAFVLPPEISAQSTNVKPRNTNQSVKFKSGIFRGSGNLIASNAITSFIGGGYSNAITAGSSYAVVGGGRVNRASGESATIGGGYNNNALTEGATVGGGRNNDATGLTATVAGGDNNIAGGETSAVAGGSDNNAIGDQSFIGTGNNNDSFGSFAVIVSGLRNTNGGAFGFIGSGQSNTNTAPYGFVGSGQANLVSGDGAIVTGGYYNAASGYAAMVPGGFDNVASGAGAFAAGQKAQAIHDGAFVWSILDATTSSDSPDSFTVRAPGGARFLTTYATGGDPLVGVQLTNAATAWSSLSDSNAKTAVKVVDPRAVLAKVDALPVTEWEYKHDPRRKYFGPMSQDFHAAFGLGRDDKTINTLDADGVLFLSVKGLLEEIKLRDKAIEELRIKSVEVDELKAKLQAVEERLKSLPPAP